MEHQTGEAWAGGGALILLVDDDPAVLESLRRVLATEGWRVIPANSGEEALELLLEHEPDLIITDLRMAAVSGWDLLFHEQVQRPRLPIFVVTALSLATASEAAQRATEFFQKPVDLEVLLAAVHRHLARDPERTRTEPRPPGGPGRPSGRKNIG